MVGRSSPEARTHLESLPSVFSKRRADDDHDSPQTSGTRTMLMHEWLKEIAGKEINLIPPMFSPPVEHYQTQLRWTTPVRLAAIPTAAFYPSDTQHVYLIETDIRYSRRIFVNENISRIFENTKYSRIFENTKYSIFREYSRIFAEYRKYSRIFENTKIFENIREYSRIRKYSRIFRNIREYENIREYSRIYENIRNIREYSRIKYSRIRKYSRIFENIRQNTKIFAYIREYSESASGIRLCARRAYTAEPPKEAVRRGHRQIKCERERHTDFYVSTGIKQLQCHGDYPPPAQFRMISAAQQATRSFLLRVATHMEGEIMSRCARERIYIPRQ
ncbi:unnamed protein product [Trichogramma brassicae]|uniref:Uncharacterized protein n=1 Tax=Trichogramma brassicae TaxID=86971 RepID=A0A6H5IHP0_9HYME|nr:unnamed protein product [Trichogramma brassicae]